MIDISNALNPKGRFIHSYVLDRLIIRHTTRDTKITFSTEEPIMKVPALEAILPKEAITLISKGNYGLLSMTDGINNIRCKLGRTIYFIMDTEVILNGEPLEDKFLIENIEITADILLSVLGSNDTYISPDGTEYRLGQMGGPSAKTKDITAQVISRLTGYEVIHIKKKKIKRRA